MKKNSSGNRKYTENRSVWFLELKRFTAAWSDLRLNVEDLFDLQETIRRDPNANPVVPGTGGLRKMRFASPRIGNKGKRGSLRVCYAHIARFSCIVLLSVYSKGDVDDMPSGAKKSIKSFLTDFENELGSRPENEL